MMSGRGQGPSSLFIVPFPNFIRSTNLPAQPTVSVIIEIKTTGYILVAHFPAPRLCGRLQGIAHVRF